MGNTTGIEQLYSEAIPEEVENPIEEYAEYISITETNETAWIDVTEYLLSETQATVFNITKSNISVHYYTDQKARCSIINETESKEMQCSPTMEEEQHKGIYMCTTELILTSKETNETTSQEYEVSCKTNDLEQNVMEEAVHYTLTKTDTLSITAVSPGDNEEVGETKVLTVTTSS